MATKKANKAHQHTTPKSKKRCKLGKKSQLSFSFKTGFYYLNGKQIWPGEGFK